jgi:uncharacterized protein YndB with AHSA1/START domain
MLKTGEAYTTARIRLLQRNPSMSPEAEVRSPERTTLPLEIAAPASGLSTPDYAKLAGMSDAAIKAKTGCTWDRWVKALDHHQANTWPHAQIAEFVHTKYKVGDWWAQTVTVGYERIKGLRAIGQRRDGGFEATKSRIFPVSVSRLYQAWHKPRSRALWLEESKLVVRTARANRSMRITWPDQTSVEVMFYPKPGDKSQVTIAHRKLPDRATSDRMKAYWTERLAALAQLLNEKGGR